MEALFNDSKISIPILSRARSLIQEAFGERNHVALIQLLSIFAGLFITQRLTIFIYNVWFHPLRKFPGPAHMAAFYLPYLYDNFISGQMHNTIRKLHRKYGRIVRIGPDHLAFEGSIAWVEVFGHKGEKEEFEKVPNYVFEGDTTGIVGAPKAVHRRQRRQLSHAFSDGALRDQGVVMKKYVDLLMKRFTERSDTGKSFNIIDWFNFTTFDIIGHLTYSESFHCLENKGYHPWVSQFYEGVRGEHYRRFFSRYPLVHEIIKWLGLSNDINKNNEHRYYIVEKTLNRIKLGDYAIDGYRDFISFMLKKNNNGELGFVGEELLTSSSLITGAGAETTAAAMSALVFYICSNSNAHNRLVEELHSTFANEEDITLKATQQLEYLHACIEETLRVYPPINETPPRICPGDTIDGKYIPAGTAISVFQEATYHNPEHWAEPDSYIPERWLSKSHPFNDSRFENDNRAVFKPFSYGPRDCVGKNLAYSEMRLIVARMFYQFDFKLAPEQDDWHSSQRTFLAWERKPLYVYLKRRHI
ncbi:cytochrome P450, partial [Trichoderma chlorosporum]